MQKHEIGSVFNTNLGNILFWHAQQCWYLHSLYQLFFCIPILV